MSTHKRASETNDRPVRGGPHPDAWPPDACRDLLLSCPWPMFVLDCETHRIVEANSAAIDTYHMDLETLQREGVERAVPPHRLLELIRLLDRGADAPPRDFFSEHILPDQTLMPVEVRSFALLWKQRASRCFLMQDLRSRPAPDHSASDLSPRAMGGRLPSSAVHDFNNLLTVVLAVAEQLQAGEGNLEQQVDLIARTVRSAQELAKERLSLDGPQTPHNERLDLNAVLTDQEDILKGLLGRQSALITKYDASLMPVFANPEQLREVILNLAVNARDAMPGGGKLTITTSNVAVDAKANDFHLPAGPYVRLAVEDNGVGMTEETRKLAFQPYFSTKSHSASSGLGLPSVASIVQQNGGAIRLTSKPGQGSLFEIFLPSLTGSDAPPATRAHILLIEDSVELRRMIQSYLSSRGYDVVSCGTAEAALKWGGSKEHPIDLILCDLILPDLTGTTLVEQLLLLHAGSRVIFMSGHPEASQSAASVGGRHLEKPFSLHRLSEMIEETMKE